MLYQTYKLLQKTQGRDKLTKCIIYLLKMTDACKSIYTKRDTYRFERMAQHFQRARQIMRLGKFVQEFSRILQSIREPCRDHYRRLVQIVIFSCFSFYWLLDNLSLLSAFNIVNVPEFELSQTAMTIKVIALSIAAFLNLRNWIKLHHEEIKAKRMLKVLKDQDNLSKNVQLIKLIEEQWEMFLLCVKIYGDILPSLARSKFVGRTIRLRIPRILQALGGLINALVSCFLTSL